MRQSASASAPGQGDRLRQIADGVPSPSKIPRSKYEISKQCLYNFSYCTPDQFLGCNRGATELILSNN